MLRGSNWLPLVMLLLLARSSGSASSPAAAPLGSGQVEKVRTGGADERAWAAPRFALAVEVLAPNVGGANVREVALSVLAQWAHETAGGKSEFNFNLGGWRARKKDPFFVAADSGEGPTPRKWTAYPSLPLAIADQLQRLHDVFPSAWRLLVANPLTSAWVEELGRRGYYTAPREAYARSWGAWRVRMAAALRPAVAA